MSKKNNKTTDVLFIFLKGMLMGICDIIPGVSGGTIAFITGIYERLINAVRGFSFRLLGNLVTLKRKALAKEIEKLDLGFLIPLGLGIGISVFVGSSIIGSLLENYFLYTISFFIGLIFASGKVIFDNITNHKPANILFGVVGLLFGLSLSVLIPANVVPTLPYVFLGGFIAISAMFLPGISGAFILVIMGIYEFLLNVLHNLDTKWPYFIAFGIGAGAGMMVISRLISYLFKKDKCKTLYVLLGLVFGALSIPVRNSIQSVQVWQSALIISSVILAVLGVVVVLLVSYLSKSTRAKDI